MLTGALARAYSKDVHACFTLSDVYFFVSILPVSAISTLKTLKLGNNRLGDVGAVALAGALRVRQPRPAPPLHVDDRWMDGWMDGWIDGWMAYW